METTIQELSSAVNVTVHKNYLKDGNSSYAKVRRRTAGINNVIAKILKMPGALDKATLFHSAILFKDGILEVLKSGYAVDLFELGTLYLNTVGDISSENPTTADIPTVSLSFTPSQEALLQMADVNVDAAVKEDCEPTISTIEDRFTFKTDGSATLGNPVRITGKRLRIAGEDDTGIFLAKLDENGAHSSDMQTWLKVSKIGTNEPATLEFYLPSEAESGSEYALIIRTASGAGKRVNKTVRETLWNGKVKVVSES